MSIPVDPGTALQDNLDYVFLAGTTGLHARFLPLYTALNGALASDNMLLSGAFPWTGEHTFSSTKLHILSSGAAFDLILAVTTVFTADRTLTIDIGDGNKTFTLGGNFTTSGSNALTLTTIGSTNVSLPTAGTLATLAGSENLSNKTLTSPIISTISNTGTLTLPTSTDTLIGRATTDTLTNKTLTSPTISGGSISGITDLAIADGGTGASTASAARTNLQVNAQLGWFNNIALVRATTTNAGDSIKITSADGTALSASNVGIVRLPSTVTAGLTVEFSVTADVTILLTGAHWGIGGTGDITGGLLRVLAINDNGTLKWGVAYLGGRNIVLTTDTSTTQANIDLPEEILCNSAVGSSSNRCREIGWFRAGFDDTGGAAEDLWSIESGINDVVTGQTADGLYQPWNPAPTGFSSGPTIVGSTKWSQTGRIINLNYQDSGDGVSNTTAMTMSLPTKSRWFLSYVVRAIDNGLALSTPGLLQTAVGSITATLRSNTASGAWTAANAKSVHFNLSYEVGPLASFID